MVAVLGVLAAGLIALINPIGQTQRSRDGRRKADLKQIQTALELYRSDCGSYPASGSNTIPSPFISDTSCTGSSVTYAQTVPKDPKGQDYYYEQTASGYNIYSCAENPSSNDVDVSPSVPSGVSSRFTGCTKYFKYTNP